MVAYRPLTSAATGRESGMIAEKTWGAWYERSGLPPCERRKSESIVSGNLRSVSGRAYLQ
jgi:hypothetical protein